MISCRDLLKGSAAAGLGLVAVGLVDGLRFALPGVAAERAAHAAARRSARGDVLAISGPFARLRRM
jgi:hypothetical protein